LVWAMYGEHFLVEKGGAAIVDTPFLRSARLH